MSMFKTTTVSTLPAIIEPLSESAKFWKNNVNPATVYRELNSINCIDINKQNQILTTSARKISLYDTESLEKKRTFQSQNHSLLYGGIFRKENQKLFATGADDGIVRIWECKKSKPLRSLGYNNNNNNNDNENSAKHSAPVHRVNFNGLNQLISCGDDKEIKLWDFIEEKIICKFNDNHDQHSTTAHNDYIRASCFIDNASLFVSGSYDNTVKIWDIRQPQKSCYQYNHKQSVESITNRDLLIISSSDSSIQIFDVIAGKILRKLDNVHHKTITCIHNYDTYLLTVSIDGHLKIFDYNFNVITSFNYQPSQLLSCYYNGSYLAVGTNDGILSVNKISKTTNKSKAAISSNKNLKKSINEDVDDDDDDDDDDEIVNEFFFNNIPEKNKSLQMDKKNMFIISTTNNNNNHNNNLKNLYKQEKHEQLLRKFRYSAAFNRVFKKFAMDNPEKVINFMQELIRRNAIQTSLAGRNIDDIKRIIKFIIHNLSDIRFTRILLDISLIMTTIYTNDIINIKKVRTIFKELNDRIDNEIINLKQMCEIDGQLQFLINSQIK